MASSKINPKGKSKDEKTKLKSLSTIGEDGEDLDFALLRKPIQTRITGFAQARKIFDLATEELKDLLSNECDILYECKVCRNIFRSLVNFISHKRVYCKEKFSTSTHGHFIESCSMAHEVQRINNLEKGYQESVQNGNKNDDEDDRIPLSKDLTSIIEKISMNKEMFVNVPGNQQVVLRNIPNSSVAVFQNVNNEENSQDNMQAEVGELTEILSRDKAILQEDGSFKIQSSVKMSLLPENVIQISDDDDGDEQPKCKLCGQKFSTMKTLKFHMKYKHLESRLVYPCPDCLEIFSTSWSVYRHLFKVHRKTAAQIRRLRESIQAKAFKLNNPPAFYEKRKNNNSKLTAAQKITEEERLEQENQEWMDNMEGDSEIPRCGGCGRTFERRAALAAHTNTCQPRSRALNKKPESKKIEIQIRKDYIKPPKNNEKIIETNEKDKDNILEEAIMDVDFHNINHNEKPIEKTKSPEQTKEKSTSPEKQYEYSLDDVIPSIQLPFAQQAEKSNMASLKLKLSKDVIIEELTCKVCNNKSKSVQKLFDHMADHYKWLRYACKLCNFKHFTYERLPQHVKEVHKLRGDSDFYFSTIKALDGGEALDLANMSEEQHEGNDSPDSRRPSRCSSDSSRLSDDSSSSCARTDMSSRKRKQTPQKNILKKKKDNDDDEQSRDGLDNAEGDSNLSGKFDENSSDIEDIEEKLARRMGEPKAIPTRRPVRNKTKRKNEDFEYDLSNLLKREAQGYNAYTNTKTIQTNTKAIIKPIPNKKEKKEKEKADNAESNHIVKECSGALLMLSKKTAQKGKALLKTNYNVNQSERLAVFVRPMVPKILARGDKASPKKDVEETKVPESQSTKDTEHESQTSTQTPKSTESNSDCIALARSYLKSQLSNAKAEISLIENSKSEEIGKKITVTSGPDKSQSSIPAIVPIKFRRESLEVIKNPLINKNINDLKKAGMKTKILVIKPIHRNKDGPMNSNLKYQTIKFNKSLEGSKNEKVVVVQVPKVDCNIKGPLICNNTSTNAQTIKPGPDTFTISDAETEKAKTENGKPEETIIISDKSEADLEIKDDINFVTENGSQNQNDENVVDNDVLTLSGDSNANETNNEDATIDSIELVEASV